MSAAAVVRVVRAGCRGGRGRFWRKNGAGYTDRLEEAGLYTPGPDPTLEHETWFEAPIWAFRDEVARTIVAVEVEIERLQGRVNRLRTWPDQVLCVGSSRDSFDFVPSPSTVSKCERPAFGAPEEEPDGAPCDAAPVLVPLAFCPYRSRESLACTEPAP